MMEKTQTCYNDTKMFLQYNPYFQYEKSKKKVSEQQ